MIFTVWCPQNWGTKLLLRANQTAYWSFKHHKNEGFILRNTIKVAITSRYPIPHAAFHFVLSPTPQSSPRSHQVHRGWISPRQLHPFYDIRDPSPLRALKCRIGHQTPCLFHKRSVSKYFIWNEWDFCTRGISGVNHPRDISEFPVPSTHLGISLQIPKENAIS